VIEKLSRRRTRHVAIMRGKEKCIQNILGKRVVKDYLRRIGIRGSFVEILCENKDWIQLAQSRA
jgi:hypothetical protein